MIIARPAWATPPWLADTPRRCRYRGSNLRPAPPAPGRPGRQKVIADVAGQPVADLIEHARVEGVHTGIGQIRDRMDWLLDEPGDPAGRRRVPRPPRRTGWASGIPPRSRSCRGEVGVDERPEVEVRQVVGIAGQETCPRRRPTAGWPGACQRCRAVPARRTCGPLGGAPRAARWLRTTSGRWCRLTRTSSIPARSNSSSQISSRGRSPKGSMHFGVVSVIGRRRLPTPAASRNAFTPPPYGQPRERASARWPRPVSRPGRPSP